MANRLVGPRGLAVEQIRLDGQDILRVTQHGTLLGDCVTLPELGALLSRHGFSMDQLIEAPSEDR